MKPRVTRMAIPQDEGFPWIEFTGGFESLPAYMTFGLLSVIPWPSSSKCQCMWDNPDWGHACYVRAWWHIRLAPLQDEAKDLNPVEYQQVQRSKEMKSVRLSKDRCGVTCTHTTAAYKGTTKRGAVLRAATQPQGQGFGGNTGPDPSRRGKILE
jgi:hypothetical protein